MAFFGKKTKSKVPPSALNLRRRFHHLQIEKRRTEMGKTPIEVSRPRRIIARHQALFLSIAKKGSAILGILGGFIGIIYIVFFSTFFSITKISFEKNGTAVSASELQPFLDKLKGSNLLFVNESSLQSSIEDAFRSKILLARVRKSYPHQLVVRIEEYPTVLNLKITASDKTKTYVINQIGVAISENTPQKDIPTVTVNMPKLPVSEVVIQKNKLDPIARSLTRFSEIFGLKVPEAVWMKVEREIRIKTEKGFTVWIDLTADVDKQLNKLKRALAKLDIYREPLEYIDLRIPGAENEKVIFKRKK